MVLSGQKCQLPGRDLGQGSPLLPKAQGHSCKIGNMRCPGTLKNQNPQFEEKK